MSNISRDGVHLMFDEISKTYDRANHVMTFGLDRYWRKSIRKHLPKNAHLLDMATGTGDQILSLIDDIDSAVGIDLSEEMLAIGKEKCKRYGNKVRLETGNALKVDYPDASFDAITMSFGIRNVTDTLGCLKEMRRLLKPGGRALILEGGTVSIPIIKSCHLFYMRHILPRIGALVSGHKSAYRYLNQTIESYPYGSQFCELMQKSGFKDVKAHPMMLGSVYIYVGST